MFTNWRSEYNWFSPHLYFFIFNILFIIPFQMLNMISFKLIWFGADFRGKLINYSVLKLEKLRNCTESELEIEQFIVGGKDIFKLLDSEKRYLSFWMKEKCKGTGLHAFTFQYFWALSFFFFFATSVSCDW